MLWAALEGDPAAAWAYAYREMFGAEGGGWEVPGGFNSYRRLLENQCDAGSLVRRAVFDEHGVMFDPSMRSGYEDWEFFIRAMRRGLRGVSAGRCGFRYRRRAFSMVERSMREHELLIDQIRARHPDAYAPRALARREHEALPRFALVDGDAGTVELTASVDLPPRASTIEELVAAAGLDSQSGAYPAPAVTVVGSGAAFAWLRAERLDAGVLLAAQRLLGDHERVGLRLAGEAETPRLRISDAAGGPVDAVALRTPALRADSGTIAPDVVLEISGRGSVSHPPASRSAAPGAGALTASPATGGGTGAATHARFAAELHLDRFETTLPWTGEPVRGSRTFLLVAPATGPRPEFMRWLWALRRSELDAAVHLVLAGENDPAAAGAQANPPAASERPGPIDLSEFDLVIPIPAETELATDLLTSALAAADVVINCDCPMAPDALRAAPRASLVVDASSSLADDALAFRRAASSGPPPNSTAIDLFCVGPGGSARLANLDVIEEKIVELPVNGDRGANAHFLTAGQESDAGLILLEALAAVPPRPETRA